MNFMDETANIEINAARLLHAVLLSYKPRERV